MDIFSIILHFVGLGLLLLCSSFFSGSETALSALSRAHLQRMRGEPGPAARAVVRFLDEPRRLFITVLFGNTLVNMAFISITGSLVYNRLFRGGQPGFAFVLAALLPTAFLLVFGEITPKTYALAHAERFSRIVARPLWVLSAAIYPVRKALRWLTDILLRLLGIRSVVDRTPLTADEIKALFHASGEQGDLGEKEGEILHNIFELHDIPAKEAMVPRTAMISIDVSRTIQEAFALTRETGHSRIPVFRNTVDNICGVFYVKDLPCWKGIMWRGRGIDQITLEEFITGGEERKKLNPDFHDTLVRPPFFAFRTRSIGSLMREMSSRKQQMAILLDEFGGVSGLITTEDIIEEILGEIFDEYDKLSELTITRDSKDDTAFLVPGFVSLRSVNRQLKLKLGLGSADTIGGYVVRLSGRFPDEGAVVADRSHGVEFEVLQTTGRRIGLLRLRKIPGPSKGGFPFLGVLLLFFLMGMFPVASLPGGNHPGVPVVQGGWSTPAGFSTFAFAFLLLVCLVLVGFYEGAETAVVSASRARIEALDQRGDPRAGIIKKFWKEPERMLGIVLVGTNLMSAAAGAAGLRLIMHAFPQEAGIQEVLNTAGMTFLILVFCEILPKTTFRARADALALRSAKWLWISGIILRPLVAATTAVTSLLVPGVGREDGKERQRAVREELRLLARMGARHGVLRGEQLRMISSVLDLDAMSLEKVMTPLVDIVALPVETPVDVFYKTVCRTGFSRIPVYEERVDNLIGLVNVLDVLYAESSSPTIASFVQRQVRHEPESKRVSSLLRELLQSRETMIFVVDEYGGIVGLVTVEDLVEEIWGEIRDEKDKEEDGRVRRLSETVLECEGKTEIQLLNSAYGMEIPEGEYNTIAGYVISQMEKIPRVGECLETTRLKIVILEADPRGIRRVRIQKKE